jgi:hypothetical protein
MGFPYHAGYRRLSSFLASHLAGKPLL